MKIDRTYAALGLVIVSIAIFVFFGMRWFEGLHLKNSFVGGVPRDTQWPPQINYCPDFLTLKQVGTGSAAKYFCVDAMGVSSLPRFTKTSTVDTTSNTVNYIELTKDKTAQQYTTTNFLGGPAAGITWEGVYDGMSATNVIPPFPY